MVFRFSISAAASWGVARPGSVNFGPAGTGTALGSCGVTSGRATPDGVNGCGCCAAICLGVAPAPGDTGATGVWAARRSRCSEASASPADSGEATARGGAPRLRPELGSDATARGTGRFVAPSTSTAKTLSPAKTSLYAPIIHQPTYHHV